MELVDLLKPVNYTSRIEALSTYYADGTRDRLIQLVDIWLGRVEQDSTSRVPMPISKRIMWLQGESGAGKSTFAAKMGTLLSGEDAVLGCVLFSSSSVDITTPVTIIKSIAYQVAQIFPELQEMLTNAITHLLHTCDTNTTIAYWMTFLLLNPLNTIQYDLNHGYKVIIIDGIDDIPPEQQVEFVDLIRLFAVHLPAWIKLFITASVTSLLPIHLPPLQPLIVNLEQSMNEADIGSYFRMQLQPLVIDTLLMDAAIVLTKKSANSFLYASMIMKELQMILSNGGEKLSNKEELAAVLDMLPADLSLFFEKKFSTFVEKTPPNMLTTYMEVLTLLTFSQIPLSITLLKVLYCNANQPLLTTEAWDVLLQQIEFLFITRKDVYGHLRLYPTHLYVQKWLVNREKSLRCSFYPQDSHRIVLQRMLNIHPNEHHSFLPFDYMKREEWKHLDEEVHEYIYDHLLMHLDAAGLHKTTWQYITSLESMVDYIQHRGIDAFWKSLYTRLKQCEELQWQGANIQSIERLFQFVSCISKTWKTVSCASDKQLKEVVAQEIAVGLFPPGLIASNPSQAILFDPALAYLKQEATDWLNHFGTLQPLFTNTTKYDESSRDFLLYDNSQLFVAASQLSSHSIATVTKDCVVCVWNAYTGKCEEVLHPYQSAPSSSTEVSKSAWYFRTPQQTALYHFAAFSAKKLLYFAHRSVYTHNLNREVAIFSHISGTKEQLQLCEKFFDLMGNPSELVVCLVPFTNLQDLTYLYTISIVTNEIYMLHLPTSTPELLQYNTLKDVDKTRLKGVFPLRDSPTVICLCFQEELMLYDMLQQTRLFYMTLGFPITTPIMYYNAGQPVDTLYLFRQIPNLHSFDKYEITFPSNNSIVSSAKEELLHVVVDVKEKGLHLLYADKDSLLFCQQSNLYFWTKGMPTRKCDLQQFQISCGMPLPQRRSNQIEIIFPPKLFLGQQDTGKVYPVAALLAQQSLRPEIYTYSNVKGCYLERCKEKETFLSTTLSSSGGSLSHSHKSKKQRKQPIELLDFNTLCQSTETSPSTQWVVHESIHEIMHFFPRKSLCIARALRSPATSVPPQSPNLRSCSSDSMDSTAFEDDCIGLYDLQSGQFLSYFQEDIQLSSSSPLIDRFCLLHDSLIIFREETFAQRIWKLWDYITNEVKTVEVWTPFHIVQMHAIPSHSAVLLTRRKGVKDRFELELYASIPLQSLDLQCVYSEACEHAECEVFALDSLRFLVQQPWEVRLYTRTAEYAHEYHPVILLRVKDEHYQDPVAFLPRSMHCSGKQLIITWKESDVSKSAYLHCYRDYEEAISTKQYDSFELLNMNTNEVFIRAIQEHLLPTNTPIRINSNMITFFRFLPDAVYQLIISADRNYAVLHPDNFQGDHYFIFALFSVPRIIETGQSRIEACFQQVIKQVENDPNGAITTSSSALDQWKNAFTKYFSMVFLSVLNISLFVLKLQYCKRDIASQREHFIALLAQLLVHDQQSMLLSAYFPDDKSFLSFVADIVMMSLASWEPIYNKTTDFKILQRRIEYVEEGLGEIEQWNASLVQTILEHWHDQSKKKVLVQVQTSAEEMFKDKQAMRKYQTSIQSAIMTQTTKASTSAENFAKLRLNNQKQLSATERKAYEFAVVLNKLLFQGLLEGQIGSNNTGDRSLSSDTTNLITTKEEDCMNFLMHWQRPISQIDAAAACRCLPSWSLFSLSGATSTPNRSPYVDENSSSTPSISPKKPLSTPNTPTSPGWNDGIIDDKWKVLYQS